MRKILVSAIAAFAIAGSAAHAAETPKLPNHDWTFEGVFGYFDKAQLRRGYKIYRQVCSGCHGMRLLYYRDLEDLGYSEDQVKEIASQYEVPAPPNEWGETYVDGERLMQPAKPSDHFISPYPNENAARAANAGALPPDLSVMAKARKGGPDYIYALLTGFKDEPPEGFKMMEGMYYNEYFPGHQIAMPQPLFDEAVDYEDGTPMTLDQYAKDISAFLEWSASPELEARKSLGIKVILFLIVLTALFYALKRKIWADVH
jgi:cytochrome c1